MKLSLEILKLIGFRYKKSILLAAVSGLMVVGLAVTAFGLLSYKVLSFVVEGVKSRPAVELPSSIEVPNTGFVGEVISGLASSWVERTLAANEIVTFKNGLACLDAVGGPSPMAVIDYLKASLDQNTAKRLQALASSLKEAGALPDSEPKACVNWILSS